MQSYQNENNEFVTKLIRKRFLGSYKGTPFPYSEVFNNLELIIDKKCNLGCKYCYYDKFADQYFNNESLKKESILQNAKEVATWLKGAKLTPKLTLFSGDILYRDIGIELIEIFSEYTQTGGFLTLPTNGTFLMDDAKTEEIGSIIKDKNISISLSVEGLHCEHSRPLKGKQKDNRDEKYYDTAFKFAKEYNTGFHPMVHSSNIRSWKKNFMWFLEMYIKHDIPLNRLYLLEVRNNDWTKEDLQVFSNFIEFMIEKTFRHICNSDRDVFIDFIFKQRGFNILSNNLISIVRGTGCSLQSTLCIRLGDMTIVPCHRLAYKWFEMGKLKLPEVTITDSKKPELISAIYSAKVSNFPKCDYCMIKNICMGQCLGAQFEHSYDLFYPNEVVCALLHTKVRALIKGFKSIGVFDEITNSVNYDKSLALREADKLFNK